MYIIQRTVGAELEGWLDAEMATELEMMIVSQFKDHRTKRCKLYERIYAAMGFVHEPINE